jgi:hypothetical protein
MPFGTATVITRGGFAIISNRLQNTATVAAPRYVGIGVGATAAARTAAASDTALSSEVETRTAGTETQQTTTETNDTYQVVGVVTATGSRDVDEMGLFNASSAGTMFLSATHAVIALAVNDSVQYTAKCKIS